jgi:tricarballylate dehydrogenase
MNIAERDIIVVGAGNAAMCAALSARENGASVLMLEIAPEEAACGNSAFTGGAFRVVHHGFDDLAQLIPDLSEHELSNVDVGTYTAEQYHDDVGRLTEWRCDPDLAEIRITLSFGYSASRLCASTVYLQPRDRKPGTPEAAIPRSQASNSSSDSS